MWPVTPRLFSAAPCFEEDDLIDFSSILSVKLELRVGILVFSLQLSSYIDINKKNIFEVRRQKFCKIAALQRGKKKGALQLGVVHFFCFF